MSLTLYTAPMSSATPVEHALAELGVPHEKVRFDLAAGDQKAPEYLALNPNGKVPTLVADGTPLFEALAIMQWLGDRYGVERNLWPASDAPERLTAMAWSTWAYVTYGAALSRLSYTERAPNAELHHPPLAAHTRSELRGLLDVLESRLKDRPYLLGGAFSLADLIVASVVTYGTYVGASTDAHPAVTAWLSRFHARECYRATWQ